MTQYLDLDVRPILRGGEPFSLIMAALEGLEVGQGLRLYAPFKPVPLFAVMSEKGLPTPTASSTERIGKCCSHLVGAKADTGSRAGENPHFATWPEPVVELDNRDLAPPEGARLPVLAARKARLSPRRDHLRVDSEGAVMTDQSIARVRNALRVVINPELGGTSSISVLSTTSTLSEAQSASQ